MNLKNSFLLHFFCFFILNILIAQNTHPLNQNVLAKSLEVNENEIIQDVEKKLKLKQAKFILFRITNQLSKEHTVFTQKFGVGFQVESCAIDPVIEKKAKITNKYLASYLSAEFGELWKKEIPELPFGLLEFSEK